MRTELGITCVQALVDSALAGLIVDGCFKFPTNDLTRYVQPASIDIPVILRFLCKFSRIDWRGFSKRDTGLLIVPADLGQRVPRERKDAALS